MRRRTIDEGDEQKPKAKPRGRPFSKGYEPHNKRKSDSTLLDDSGRESGVDGGVIEDEQKESIVEPLNKEIEPSNETPVTLEQPDIKGLGEIEGDQIMERIDFFNGGNKISLILSKRHNRMFKFRIFMNDETELKGATYTGASTGYGFWKLLKGAMKK